MARRATIFSGYDDPHTLRIAGPYELAKWPPARPLDAERVKPLIRGYELLAYDLGVLGTSEASALPLLAKDQPQTWLRADSHPHIHPMTTAMGSVMAVVFPTLQPDGTPSESMLSELVTTLTDLRHSHPKALLVGISSWGREHERRFLDDHEGRCDILLGSGPGPGLTSVFSSHAKTLWTRAYTKGRTVNKIEIREFPSPSASFNWKNGRNISTKLLVLGEKIQDNPAMDAILAPLDAVAKAAQTTRKNGSCGH